MLSYSPLIFISFLSFLSFLSFFSFLSFLFFSFLFFFFPFSFLFFSFRSFLSFPFPLPSPSLLVDFGVGYVSQFTLVMNALDNLAARRHVNRVCVASGIPLVESGTGQIADSPHMRKKDQFS